MTITQLSSAFQHPKKILSSFLHTFFWFFLGAVLGLFFFASFVYMYYQHNYANKVYPGVIVNNIEFGGKTKKEVQSYFSEQNRKIANKRIQFNASGRIATTSARSLSLGYDDRLLAQQAYSIGRSGNFFSDIYLCLEAYLHGVSLSPAYTYSEDKLTSLIKPFQKEIDSEPVDARFTFENNRVTEFKSAKNGKQVDVKAITTYIQEEGVPALLTSPAPSISVTLPVKTIKPKVTNEEANSLGIKERIGIGTSLFHGSIPTRIYNLQLAASRLNGILIKPGEIFSFDKALGDVSSLTGYKQAYVIQNGRTVLGDGGGVCQISTTFFRALLNAGLPITERTPHAYRVHYYEDDLGPGVDAAIYVPTVDLKFKNDTGKTILVQSSVDITTEQVTFELYGTNDGRSASISKPVIVSQSPAPEPLYEDDPNLPVGQVQQVDFAASGAVVYFDYEVTNKDGKTTTKRFTSHYKPWRAVYKKGTKTG